MGKPFLQELYRQIATSPWGSVHVAIEDDTVIGFIVGTQDIFRCALGFTLSGYLKMAGRLLVGIWRPQIAWKLLDSLAYPFRTSSTSASIDVAPNKHRAELLAIAVSQAAQGKGVGRALVGAYENTLPETVTQYFVTTNTTEVDSNAFYSSMSFQSIGEKRHHDLLIRVYAKQLRNTTGTPLV
jgi:GNAT superfamily N-acetyltransferase